MAWYQDRECLVCKQKIGKLHFWNEKPKIIDAKGSTVQWRGLDDAKIDGLLKENKPVCYPCYTDRLRDMLDILGVEA